MSLIDILTIVGAIMALGSAFDFLAKDDSKKAVASYFENIQRKEVPTGYSLSGNIDKIIGTDLFSIRAISAYVAFSLLSLPLTYAFAYNTTELDTVAIFFGSPSKESLVVFATCLLGCIIGDCLSYAQTRFFLTNVDRERRGIISLGFAISDVILSLSIFLIIFTITRLAAYFLVIGTTQIEIVRTQEVNAALANFTIERLVEEGTAREEELRWSSYMASAKSPEKASVIDEISRGYDTAVLGIENTEEEFAQKVEFRCSEDLSETYFANGATADVIAREIALHRGIEVGGASYSLLIDDIKEQFELWRPNTGDECPFPLFTITQKINAQQLIQIAGLSNVLWASFERTMFDFYTNIGYKLAPYAYFDPRSDLPRYYQSLGFLTEYSILGLRPGNYQASRILAEFRYNAEKDVERLQIPFSPMLASALSVSGLFWIYLILIYFSRLAVALQNQFGRLVSRFDVSKGPAISFGLAVSIVIFGFWSVTGLFGWFWSNLF